jgi:PKD repeat protein
MTVAPMPAFALNRATPSRDEPVQFFDFSYDPGGEGIASWAWDFGDGSRSTQAAPQHRFSSDGDYVVTLTVTTADGRAASSSQRLRVRTVRALPRPSGGPSPPTVCLRRIK